MHPLTERKARLPQLRTPVLIAAAAVLITSARGASAQAPPDATPSPLLSKSLGLTVQPAKGQSRELQGADETECYFVTKEQTGVDPLAKPAPAADRRKSFDTGFGTCLEARGYSVK
jgi:hypothetical protein